MLRSWAVPKGPSLDPGVRRLAIQVPDHSLEHADFEGDAVIIWDEGEFTLERDEPGHVVVELDGRKLRGGFALTRTDEQQWVLVKMVDDAARRASDIVAERPESVRSGRRLT